MSLNKYRVRSFDKSTKSWTSSKSLHGDPELLAPDPVTTDTKDNINLTLQIDNYFPTAPNGIFPREFSIDADDRSQPIESLHAPADYVNGTHGFYVDVSGDDLNPVITLHQPIAWVDRHIDSTFSGVFYAKVTEHGTTVDVYPDARGRLDLGEAPDRYFKTVDGELVDISRLVDIDPDVNHHDTLISLSDKFLQDFIASRVTAYDINKTVGYADERVTVSFGRSLSPQSTKSWVFNPRYNPGAPNWSTECPVTTDIVIRMIASDYLRAASDPADPDSCPDIIRGIHEIETQLLLLQSGDPGSDISDYDFTEDPSYSDLYTTEEFVL